MPYKVPPGSITMSGWNILVIDYFGDVIEKFLGYCHEDRHYRLSSQILEYDAESNIGKTESGSIYYFQDKPGTLHPLAQAFLDEVSQYEELIVRLKYKV